MKQISLPYVFILLFVPVWLVGGAPYTRAAQFCEFEHGVIETGFEGGRLHACDVKDGKITLTIAPSFAPVNPSPWYAYRILPHKAGLLTISHRYLHGRHRYYPKISVDGKNWTKAPEGSVLVTEDKSGFDLTLGTDGDPFWISAQPLITNADMAAWLTDLASKHKIEVSEIGRSVANRPILGVTTHPRRAKGLIVLMGRQHPPEVTGAMAYIAFVDRVFANDDLARTFRKRFKLALLPVVNPDGVAEGLWRTNKRGQDLNRDWGPFLQPETRAVSDWIRVMAQKTPMNLLLDFHSTWKDVFYAQHKDAETIPKGFVPAWRRAMKERLGERMADWSGTQNPGLPTAKSWAYETYGVTAITYEVGDATAVEVILEKAIVAAEEMMRSLLEGAE